MKSWEPDQEFERADFPSRRPGSPPDTTTNQPNPAEQPTRIREATFRKLESGGRITRPAQSGTPSNVPSGKVIRAGRSPSGNPGSAGPASPKAGAALSARLVQEASLAAPENTLRLLRKWFWEKWPAEAADGPIGSVAPADRICIVFRLLGKKITEYLLQLMSPVERGRFFEIIAQEREFSAASTTLVAREFMQALRGQAL